LSPRLWARRASTRALGRRRRTLRLTDTSIPDPVDGTRARSRPAPTPDPPTPTRRATDAPTHLRPLAVRHALRALVLAGPTSRVVLRLAAAHRMARSGHLAILRHRDRASDRRSPRPVRRRV